MQDWTVDEEIQDAAPPETPVVPEASQPWWTLTVLMVLLTTLLIWPLLITSFFLVSGIPELMYGKPFVDSLRDADSPTAQQASIRISLWATVVGFPIQMVLIPGMFWMLHRTRPAELNLTFKHLGRNLLLGLITWAVLSAVTLGIHYSATVGYDWLIPSGTEPHVFEQLLKGSELWPIEKVLIVIAAMLVAPVMEEMVFRGVLLRWARQQPYAADLIVAVALAASLPTSETAWQQITQLDDLKSALHASAPLIWGLILTGIYALVSWQSSSGPAARIVATAFLFAAFHGAWPSPVPLFVLALGLGWLAEKTDSLAGPMLVHCLFNGIACAQMFLE